MKDIKKALASFYDENQRMPSYGEIMQLTGYKTKSAVAYAVNKLISRGAIKKDRKGKLIPVSIGSIKLLGSVEAGFPSPAEEDLLDTISLDEYIIKNRDSTYILNVKGDSMVDAGIHEGDMVIVERSERYRDGSIVIAEVDGQWTMKYLRKKGNKVYLEAANKDYPPITPQDELKIMAVVIAVVRKY